MKRWLYGLLVLVVATPGIALAQPIPEGGAVFGNRLPIFHRPFLTNVGTTTPPYGGEVLRGAQYIGPAHVNMIAINVVMQMRNEAGLERYAALVNSPHSLYYRRFLTPQQLADFFGASQSDYTQAINYFWSQGLGVRWWKQRQMLRVVGSQANIERTFQTRFGWFQKNGVLFYAPVTPPHLSSSLAIRGIGGLQTYSRMHRHIVAGANFKPVAYIGHGFLFGNSPFDLAAGFDYTGAYSLGGSCCKGDGITIGIVGTGPISAADVPFYRSLFSVPGTGTVRQVNVTQVVTCCYSNGLVTPPPVSTPPPGWIPCQAPPPACTLPSCNPEDCEAQLDTEQTSSLAPNATVNFYLAYNPNECFSPGTCPAGSGSPQLGIGETDDEWQQIIHDNVADVVSASFGIGERDFASPSNPLLTCPAPTLTGCSGAERTIFASLAAEGIAVFVSSGDSGAESCKPFGGPNTDLLCASYPSSDPDVVSVGGTTTPIGSNGRLDGLITTWGVQTQTGGGGGGGFSAFLNRPGFQPAGNFCADKADSAGNRCDSTHRLLPDVSLNADLATGDAITLNCGSGPGCSGLGGVLIGSIGGTSASAPDAAAMWALVLEACNQTAACRTGPVGHPYRLGNPAPLLYKLNPSQYAAAFYDVNYGSNAVPPFGGTYPSLDPGFLSGPGYDLATGLGAPFARNLIKAIVGI